MSPKAYFIVIAMLLIAFGVGTGVGYYKAPTKIKTVEVIKVKTNVVTHEVKVTKPDGTTTTTTDTHDTSTTDTAIKKETIKEKKDWLVGGSVLFGLQGDRVYQVSVQRRIFGEVYVGAIGSSEGNVGLGLTIRF